MLLASKHGELLQTMLNTTSARTRSTNMRIVRPVRRQPLSPDLQIMNAIASQLFSTHAAASIAPDSTQQIDVIFSTESDAANEVDHENSQRGLSNTSIVCIPIHLTKGMQKKELCSICHENFCSDPFHKQLPCGHYFHPHCIGEWLSRSVKCPTCRGSVKCNDE